MSAAGQIDSVLVSRALRFSSAKYSRMSVTSATLQNALNQIVLRSAAACSQDLAAVASAIADRLLALMIWFINAINVRNIKVLRHIMHL